METKTPAPKFPKSRYFNEDRVDLRFKPPGRTKSFKISKLWDLHREIARRVALGETNKSVAESLGISTSVVGYTKRSKVGKDQIGILRGAMDADNIELGIRINNYAPIALKLLEDTIKGAVITPSLGPGEEKVPLGLRVKEAGKHMDRAGYSPVKKIASISTILTRDEIEVIKARSVSAAEEAGVAVDVEFSEAAS